MTIYMFCKSIDKNGESLSLPVNWRTKDDKEEVALRLSYSCHWMFFPVVTD